MKIDEFDRIDSGQYKIQTDIGQVELVRVHSNQWQMVGPHCAEKFRPMHDALVSFPEFMRQARHNMKRDELKEELIDALSKPEIIEEFKKVPHPVQRFAKQGQSMWDYVEWMNAHSNDARQSIIATAGHLIAKLLGKEVLL